ncbi:inorganic diphosphatase [Streptomyces sp. K1PN6]|uniref:Inorganic pyrophosphatase n=1 Tax=Streptomyces acidicola TaxID=2596892 RepID=A0A5N8WM86_9ACTN|nr:inorganic diphosphatase [Streptomyces acidicola]
MAAPAAVAVALGVVAVTGATASSGAASAATKVTCWPSAEGGYVHPLAYPQPAAKDIRKEGFNVVVEIPQDSITKYEIDPATGQLVADRFMSMPVSYPANYGSLPQSVGGDGDPLDGLVLTREPMTPGSVINVRPIGVLRMVDGGEADEKIVSVPVDGVDPTYADIKNIKDLPSAEQQRIEAFFRVYKQLPEGGKKVELNGYGDAAEASRLVQDSVRSYQSECAG